jgi:hypothetical protein
MAKKGYENKTNYCAWNIATIVMGVGAGNHAAYAAKVTKSSFSDGYALGVRDAGRDLKGLNGQGFDDKCPHGHTDVFCNGYKQGYGDTWFGRHQNSPAVDTAKSQSQSQSQSINNNNKNESTIHIDR